GIPAIPPSDSRVPKKVRSMIAANRGTAAPRRAGSPEETRCSAHAMPPARTPAAPAGVYEQQQPTDNRCGNPFSPSGPSRPDVAAPGGPGVEKTAGEREAHTEH